MNDSIKMKEDDVGSRRLYCGKCSTTKVEEKATDSIYRLNCNECYKHRKKNCIQEWMRTKLNTLVGCHFCSDSYRFKKKSEVHECPIVSVYQCLICAYQLNSNKSLKVHLTVAHSINDVGIRTGKNAIECKICKKSFIYSSHLKRHFRTHTGEKPFECQICTKAFVTSGQLTTHLRTHTGEKPFECKICSKTFIQSGQLKVHLRFHTGEKPFECQICTTAFATSGELTNHLTSHTGEKHFKCKICSKAFPRLANLKLHFRTHTGEKPFKCIICSKAFSRSGDLTRHLKIHTKRV